MELKEKMDRMVEELNAANYRYYVLDDPPWTTGITI